MDGSVEEARNKHDQGPRGTLEMVVFETVEAAVSFI
jgi:hypothetical protein